MTAPRPLTASEVAAMHSCHPDTVRRAIRSGRLPATRHGRAWVILETDARAWQPLPEGWQPGRPRSS